MRALARSATLLASASALSLPPRHLHHRHVAARAEAAGGVEGLTEPEEYVSTPLAGEFPASLRGTLFRLGPGAAPAPPVLARLRDRHAATPPRSRAPRRRRGAMPKARRSRRAPTPRSERTPRSLSRSERTLAGAAPRRGEARGAAASYGLACAVTFDGGGGAVARARYVRTEASLNRAGNEFELPFLRKRTAPACQRRESHRTRRSSSPSSIDRYLRDRRGLPEGSAGAERNVGVRALWWANKLFALSDGCKPRAARAEEGRSPNFPRRSRRRRGCRRGYVPC